MDLIFLANPSERHSNFQPCIGEECAFYLKTESITFPDGASFDVNLVAREFDPPCSVPVVGMKTFLDYFQAKMFAKGDLH